MYWVGFGQSPRALDINHLEHKTKLYHIIHLRNQSIENVGVAFVKGADERNKFFEKINNQ